MKLLQALTRNKRHTALVCQPLYNPDPNPIKQPFAKPNTLLRNRVQC